MKSHEISTTCHIGIDLELVPGSADRPRITNKPGFVMKSRLPSDNYPAARYRERRPMEHDPDRNGHGEGMVTAIEERDSIAGLLHLLTRLANCGMDAGAPPLLKSRHPELVG